VIEQVARRAGLSARALVSLALFCAGAWLVPSGIALHFALHDGATMWSHLFMSMHNTGFPGLRGSGRGSRDAELEGADSLHER